MNWTPAAPFVQRGLPPSAVTAKTLILVGLILEIIVAVGSLLVGLLTLFAGVGIILVAFAVVALLVLYLVYEFTYKRIQQGNFAGARTPTLVWTILLFLTLSIISAILFLIAYVKLGDAIRESQTAAVAPPYGSMPSPYGIPAYGPAPALSFAPPAAATMGNPPLGPASPTLCPRCGGPATYIPQYARWYCYRDQTYL